MPSSSATIVDVVTVPAPFDRLDNPCSSSTTGMEREMRIASKVVAFSVLLAVPGANAKTNEPCVPKAIGALPHIAGLVAARRAVAREVCQQRP